MAASRLWSRLYCCPGLGGSCGDVPGMIESSIQFPHSRAKPEDSVRSYFLSIHCVSGRRLYVLMEGRVKGRLGFHCVLFFFFL